MLPKNVALRHTIKGKIANENSGTDGVGLIRGSGPVYPAGKYCSFAVMFEVPLKPPMAYIVSSTVANTSFDTRGVGTVAPIDQFPVSTS